MTRLLISVLLFFCGASVVAQSPSVLTSAEAIYALDDASAAKSLPADFEATLTYFRPYERTMFVQDGNTALFVLATTDTPLTPGDRIRIHGTTRSGLRPYVESQDITLLGHGQLPPAKRAEFKNLISSADDCMRVTIRGRIRVAVNEPRTDVRGGKRPRQNAIHMRVLTDGGIIEAQIDNPDGRSLDSYIDADASITGIAGGRFDGKMQQTGAVVHVSSLEDVHVLHHPAIDPWSLPATPVHQVMRGYHVRDLTARVRVHGVLTYYQPGAAAVLENGRHSLWVATLSNLRLETGSIVDAIGFPDTHSGFLTLKDAVIKPENERAPITPEPANWTDLAASHKVFDLVSIEGKLITENRAMRQDEYVISSQGHIFTAIFRHNVLYRFTDDPLPSMKSVAPGSTVRITGVCIPEDANPFVREVPFSILLRSTDDLVKIANPPWLNERHLAFLVGWLMVALFIFGVREWLMERRVRRQNAELAYIEKRRVKILENINSYRPLAEIIESITELASARMHGAICWCHIADGAQLGNSPAPGVSGLRVIEKNIASRSGAALGTMYAAFDARTKPTQMEDDTLTLVVGLAKLAIETTRLHSELVRRSEFDLLTDVQNRFSMEKFLEAQIQSARQSAAIFGLLYIDMDRFKQVNDEHGHHIGDRYLQEAVQRMKSQIRPGDLLARLGGDEFAVVVTSPGSRTHLQEIAERLKRCFDEPFHLDGIVLQASASVGFAIYPEDGTDEDALLKAADCAMYVEKNRRSQLQVQETPAASHA